VCVCVCVCTCVRLCALSRTDPLRQDYFTQQLQSPIHPTKSTNLDDRIGQIKMKAAIKEYHATVCAEVLIEVRALLAFIHFM
jgi:hypothetical protein